MTANRDIRLLLCDKPSACRDKARGSALVTESVFLRVFRRFLRTDAAAHERAERQPNGLHLWEGNGLERISQQFQQTGAVSATESELGPVPHGDVVFTAG